MSINQFKVWEHADGLSWKVQDKINRHAQVYQVHLTYYDDDDTGRVGHGWECSCAVWKEVARRYKFSSKMVDCRHIRVVKHFADPFKIREDWNAADYDPMITHEDAEVILHDSELFVCTDCGLVLAKQGAAHMCGAYSKVMRKVGKTKVVYRVQGQAPKIIIPAAWARPSDSSLMAAKKRTVVIMPRRSPGGRNL